jgi:oligoendopeptidase F
MILLDGLLNGEDPSHPPPALICLDQEMLRAHANLINIPMRYEFEKSFYTERAIRRSVRLPHQRTHERRPTQTLRRHPAPGGTDPMFWAYKMHFFITGVSFYNFPYVFGYLLSQALFARFKTEGQSFLPQFEAFLAKTGSATCEEVVKQTLGEDLSNPTFWSSAIQAIEPALTAYEMVQLVNPR